MDADVAYDDSYLMKTYLLVICNAPQVSSMEHNMILSFLLREAGLHVDEQPKRQNPDTTVDTHAIFDPKSKIQIHLRLGGIFSCFKTRALTKNETDHWEAHELVF